ncbi:hypothetical protein BJX70DRAFT_356374 [Aspergillus crustosus]
MHCAWVQVHETLRRKFELARHTKVLHTERREFPCQWPGCKKVLNRNDKLLEHHRAHHTAAHIDKSSKPVA